MLLNGRLGQSENFLVSHEEHAADMAEFSDMLRPQKGGRMPRYRYIKMTPEEISEALQQTGLSVGQFSRLIGARYNGPSDSTVQKWLDGKQDAPTYLPALFALLAMPGGLETAREAAERYIEEERDDGDPNR